MMPETLSFAKVEVLKKKVKVTNLSELELEVAKYAVKILDGGDVNLQFEYWTTSLKKKYNLPKEIYGSDIYMEGDTLVYDWGAEVKA